jgi:branched-chain amino acid transport system substrate-binding protein
MPRINMADYTTLTAVKNLPQGIHSASRYIKTFPLPLRMPPGRTPTSSNTVTIRPTGHGENTVAMNYIVAAMKKTNSTDSEARRDAIRA